MKLMWTIVMIMGLGVAVAGAGCGKKDEGGASAKPQGQTAAAPASADAPSAESVKALDCKAACTQEAACIQKFGMKVHENHDRDCTQGCEMVKSMYDPAKHGTVMTRFTGLAAGKCDE